MGVEHKVEITPQNAVEATELYLQARAQKEQMTREHEERMAPIDQAMSDAKAIITAYLVRTEQTGIKTGAGTVTLTTRDNVYIADRQVFTDWVRETGNVELLETRVAKTNVIGYLTEHGELPPGIHKNAQYTVRVSANKRS